MRVCSHRDLWGGVLAIALLSGSGTALAQAFPAKPIRFVVPFAPGGTADLLARILGEKLTPRLGQAVFVDNRPGAGGNIGAAQVAQSAPDGSVFLVAATNNLVINQYLYRDMAFDPLKAFAPVTVMVSSCAPTRRSMLIDAVKSPVSSMPLSQIEGP